MVWTSVPLLNHGIIKRVFRVVHLIHDLLELRINNEVVIAIVTIFQTKKINLKPLIMDSEAEVPPRLELYKLWGA